VVSSTKIDRYYFDDSVVRFFESGNSDALAEAMLEVFRNDDLCKQMVIRGLDYARANSWERRKSDYLRLVDCLTCGSSGIQQLETRSNHSNLRQIPDLKQQP